MAAHTLLRTVTAGATSIVLALVGSGAALAAAPEPASAGTAPTGLVEPGSGPTAGGTEVALVADLAPDFVQVTAGTSHVHGLTADGVVYSWGSGAQLGLGDVTQAVVPTPIASDTFGGARVRQVAAGDTHSLALTEDGVVYAWGVGGNGQLGTGDTANARRPVPVDTTGVLAGLRVEHVAGGDRFSLVVADGAAYAWGAGGTGQLGHGLNSGSDVPVAVDRTGVLAGKHLVQIEAGSQYALALADDGTAYGWGVQASGQLGTGSVGSNVTRLPVAVQTTGALAGKRLVRIAAVSAGTSYGIASDGSAFAWGAGARGQLGNGGTAASLAPVPIDTRGLGFTEIVAGDGFALALGEDGQVYGWGSNAGSTLGTGGGSTVPEPLDDSGALDGVGVTALAAGPLSSLTDNVRAFAVTREGAVYAWGRAGAGQLGNGVTGQVTVPVPTQLLPPETRVRFGDEEATEVRRDGARVWATTRAHPSGPVDVRVETGHLTATFPEAFRFGSAPVVVEQPDDVVARWEGEQATLRASAEGDEVPVSRWEVRDPSGEWVPRQGSSLDEAGATGTTTSIEVVAPAAGVTDAYRAVFENGLGVVRTRDIQVIGADARSAPALSGVPHPGVVGEPYSYAFTVGGVPTPDVALDAGAAPLPDGLTISADGVLSGSPEQAGTYEFWLVAEEAAFFQQRARHHVVLEVYEAVTLDGDPPRGRVGAPYTYALAIGGTPDPTVRVEDGTLPPGLVLRDDGTLAGTPRAAGEFPLTVVATNGVGRDARLDLVVRVAPEVAGIGQPGREVPPPDPGAPEPDPGGTTPAAGDLAATGSRVLPLVLGALLLAGLGLGLTARSRRRLG